MDDFTSLTSDPRWATMPLPDKVKVANQWYRDNVASDGRYSTLTPEDQTKTHMAFMQSWHTPGPDDSQLIAPAAPPETTMQIAGDLAKDAGGNLIHAGGNALSAIDRIFMPDTQKEEIKKQEAEDPGSTEAYTGDSAGPLFSALGQHIASQTTNHDMGFWESLLHAGAATAGATAPQMATLALAPEVEGMGLAGKLAQESLRFGSTSAMFAPDGSRVKAGAEGAVLGPIVKSLGMTRPGETPLGVAREILTRRGGGAAANVGINIADAEIEGKKPDARSAMQSAIMGFMLGGKDKEATGRKPLTDTEKLYADIYNSEVANQAMPSEKPLDVKPEGNTVSVGMPEEKDVKPTIPKDLNEFAVSKGINPEDLQFVDPAQMGKLVQEHRDALAGEARASKVKDKPVEPSSITAPNEVPVKEETTAQAPASDEQLAKVAIKANEGFTQEGNSVAAPVMITKASRSTMKALGMTDTEINEFTPQMAQDFLKFAQEQTKPSSAPESSIWPKQGEPAQVKENTPEPAQVKEDNPKVTPAEVDNRVQEQFWSGVQEGKIDPNTLYSGATVIKPLYDATKDALVRAGRWTEEGAKAVNRTVDDVLSRFSESNPKIALATKSGLHTISKIIRTEVQSRMYSSPHINAYADAVKGLKGSDVKEMLRKGADGYTDFYKMQTTGAMSENPRIRAFQEAMKKWSKESGDIAESLGVKVKDKDGTIRPIDRVENHVPHVYSKDISQALELGHGPVWDAAAARLKEMGIDIEELHKPFSAQPSGNARKNANLEIGRALPDDLSIKTADGKVIPFFESDPFKIFPNAIENTSNRLAIIKHWSQDHGADIATGLANAVSSEIKKNPELLRSEGPERLIKKANDAGKTVIDSWNSLNGFNKGSEKNVPGFIKVMDQVALTAMLSGSHIGNGVTGWLPIAARYGAYRTTKAITKVGIEGLYRNLINPNGKLREFKTTAELNQARNYGLISEDLLQHMFTTEHLSGKTGVASRAFLRGIGIEWINAQLNKVAAISAQDALTDALTQLRNPKESALHAVWGRSPKQTAEMLKKEFNYTDVDVKRLVEQGAQPEDFARVIQQAAAKTNVFRESVLSKPLWMNQPIARRLLAFSSYQRIMSNTFMDAYGRMKGGDFAPMATLVLGGAALGNAASSLKDIVYKREKTIGEDGLMKIMWRGWMEAGVLGLPGSFGRDMYQVATGQGGQLTNMPFLSFWGNLAHGIYQQNKDVNMMTNKGNLRPVEGILKDENKKSNAVARSITSQTPLLRAADAQFNNKAIMDSNK